MKKIHYDRLIAALNKYYRPVSRDEFWKKWDTEITNNAITVAQFPDEVIDWIFEIERKAFEIFRY